MDVIDISTQIEVAPMYLDHRIKDHILSILKKRFENTCSKTFGYIHQVDKIISVKDNIVSRTTSNVLFKVIFQIQRFLPQENKTLKCNVKALFEYGIMFQYHGLNIFVPHKTIQGFVFQRATKDAKINGKQVKPGDEYSIIITSFKYENKTFTSIGRLL